MRTIIEDQASAEEKPTCCFRLILDIQGAIKNFQNRKYARGKSDILAYAIPAVPVCQLISVHVPDDAAHIGNYTAAE